jgi:hypothetical protein
VGVCALRETRSSLPRWGAARAYTSAEGLTESAQCTCALQFNHGISPPHSDQTLAPLSAGEFPTPVVSAEWLQQNLDKVQVVDASWYMPNVARDAKAEFGASRIPGAVFLDLDGVCLAESPLPHMLPPATAFAAAMDALGVTQTTPVVVYDGSGLFSAARAWWMFKVRTRPPCITIRGGAPLAAARDDGFRPPGKEACGDKSDP